jgi:choline dehydrogenase-like flavoprotein
MFYELTHLNKEVLLIEEGFDFDVALASTENQVSSSFLKRYRNGGITPIFGNPSFTFSEGLGLGGSTEVNGALFWRTPEKILEGWIHKLNLKSLEGLDKHFDFLEKTLGMSDLHPQTNESLNIVSQKLKIACDHLGWKVEPARRIAPRCLGLNYCVTGCPNRSKSSMSQTFIPRGRKLGGHVRTNFRVLRFEHKNELVTEIVGVNKKTKKVERIRCNNLILSGGALATPEILHRSSNIKVSKNRVGFHLNTKIVCEYPETVFASKGTIFTEQVQEFLDERFVFMTSNFQPEYLALSLALLDKKESERVLANIDHMAIITVQVRPFNYGIQIHHVSTSTSFFNFHFRDKQLLRYSLTKAVEGLFQSGVIRVLLPFCSEFLDSYEKAKDAIEKSSIQDWQINSVHAMSSIPMRTVASNRSVDEDGSFSNFKNLKIADASILPTTLGESPQETIMSLVRKLTLNHSK